MDRVALLFSNKEFGNALARAIETATDDYAVDVFSGIPIRYRTSLVRRGEYDLLVADEPIGNGPLAAALACVLDVPFALVLRDWADLTNAHGEHGWLRNRSIAARTRLSTSAAEGLFVLSDLTRERLAHRSGARVNAYNERAARQCVTIFKALIDGATPIQGGLPAIEPDPTSASRPTSAPTPVRQRVADPASDDQ